MAERTSRGSSRQLMSFRYAGDKCSRSRRVKQYLVDIVFSVFREIRRRSRDAHSDTGTGLLRAGAISWEVVAANSDSVKLQSLEPPSDKLLAVPDQLPADEPMKPMICNKDTEGPEYQPSDASGSDESPSASDDESDDLPLVDEPVDLEAIEWFV